MKAVVAAFNQEKALVGAFSVITNLRMELFEALVATVQGAGCGLTVVSTREVTASTRPGLGCSPATSCSTEVTRAEVI